MPVELRIETEGKTEDRRVDLAGSSRDIRSKPLDARAKIILDPDNWLLKSTPDLSVRTDILLGQQALAQGDRPARLRPIRRRWRSIAAARWRTTGWLKSI